VLVDVLVLVLVLANPLPHRTHCHRLVQSDAAWHVAIARGSAMEVAAVHDVIRLLGVRTDEHHGQAVELLGRVGSMLSKLSR
jgi:hypothetical protein